MTAENDEQLTLEQVERVWPGVVRDTRVFDKTLMALLNSGVRPAAVEGNTLTLDVGSEFIAMKLIKPNFRQIIERVLSKHTGVELGVRCKIEGSSRLLDPPAIEDLLPPIKETPAIAPQNPATVANSASLARRLPTPISTEQPTTEGDRTEMEFPDDLEPLIATLAHMFAQKGDAREVAILASARATARFVEHDEFNEVDVYSLYLQVPTALYMQIVNAKDACEQAIRDAAQSALAIYPQYFLRFVVMAPELKAETGWRAKMLEWLKGDGVNNQGRVRSDNVASRECDGLLFRSEPEIMLYQALKAEGVSFAPLPVFLRGGPNRQRIEPDFVIIKDGITMIVEVDGDTVHRELPAEAQKRLKMLTDGGALVERVRAAECNTPHLATICAKQILEAIRRAKAIR